MRGSTYAAMVIPAGTNPDTMVMEKSAPKKKTGFKKPLGRDKKRRNVYPNRDIPSPEPVPGRLHNAVQTVEYKEILNDKPPEESVGCATEFYMDRPPVPVFRPRMPDPSNCKETQIDEGDAELFDFNAEVEPMLNVLCSKTLEQARMEVLEEKELEIIQAQQKEYEEQVNAELIIAQRYEAAEKRCKDEVDRRKRQDKARKEERRFAHMKLNARKLSKMYLSGIKEQAFGQLSASGVLVKPLERAIHEEVVPWLHGEIIKYIEEDKAVEAGKETVVEDGFISATQEHVATLKAREDAKRKAEEDKEEAKRQQVLRRQRRAELREKKLKDEKLAEWKDNVYAAIINKAEIVDVLKTPATDIFGHYLTTAVVPVFGGHLFQLKYVLDAITRKFPDGLKIFNEKKIEADDLDYFKRPNNLRECLVADQGDEETSRDHLRPILMAYLRDLKCDCIEVMIGNEAAQFLKDLNVGFEDLSELSDDDLGKFKELWGQRVSPVHTDGGKHLDFMLDFAIDVLAKRLPEDGNVRVDTIHNKIVLVEMPEGLYSKDTKESRIVEQADGSKVEEIVEHKANTGEKAMLVLKVPQYEQERQVPIDIAEGEEPAKDENGELVMKTIKEMVDEDQKEKALSIVTRDVPYLNEGSTYFAVNEYAGRAIREDFLTHLKGLYPEFFEETTDFDELCKLMNQKAARDQAEFVKANCTEYEFPCMELPCSAVDL